MLALWAFLILADASLLRAQGAWDYRAEANIGCSVHMTFGSTQRFPGLRIYAAFSSSAQKGDFQLQYSPSVAIYTKTIGANLNPLIADWQVDFTNTFSLGAVWGKSKGYNKILRTLHNGDFYNFILRRNGGLFLATNFILNNHHRKQITGSILFNAEKLSLMYYNDGPPFNWIPLADNFDRYWTGGGGIFFHNAKGFNTVEFSFDQFTGYTPLLYELSNLLGINVPLYDQDIEPGEKDQDVNFNTSAYQLRINADRAFGFNAGVLGSLVSGKGKPWGIQDLIHKVGHLSTHPNNDGNRFFFGGNFNNPVHVKL